MTRLEALEISMDCGGVGCGWMEEVMKDERGMNGCVSGKSGRRGWKIL